MSNQIDSIMIYASFEDSLANGSELDSGWIDTSKFDKIQFSGYASASGMTMTIESRANERQATLSTPITYTDGQFYMFNVICRQKWMRFRWANNTGSGVTDASMELKASYGSSDKLSVFPVGVQPSDFSQASLVQSINKGRQPDGDYVNQAADGSAFSTSTNLGGTLLNGAINDSVTTITVDSTADFASSGSIRINEEIITYTGKTSTTFTGCTRGAEQTTAASHVDNADVGECYISSWIDSDGWASLEIFSKSDQPSQFLGLLLQFTDDANIATPVVRAEKKFSFTDEDVTRGFVDLTLSTILDGFRIIYVNGSTTQTSFFLDAVLRVAPDNNKYNRGGGLLTADFATEVALGFVSNYDLDTKFGRVKNIDAADNAVDIWSFADDTLATRSDTKTFPTTASVPFLASSSTSDTSVTVEVSYLDADGIARTASVSLTGQTPVSVGSSALDVNRMVVTSATGAVGTVYCTTANNYTSGVPNDVTQVLAIMQPGYNQTQQSHLTVPASKKLIIKGYDLYIARASGAAGSATVTLNIKASGTAEVIKREFFPTTSAPIIKTGSNIVVEPLSQIVWTLEDVSDNDTNCSCTWDYELVDI